MDRNVAAISDYYDEDAEKEKEARYLRMLKSDSYPNPSSPVAARGEEKCSTDVLGHAIQEQGAAKGYKAMLETLDWCAPDLTGHLSFATSQICKYERQLLRKWCDVIDQGDKLVDIAAGDREHEAVMCLRQCEDIQKESEVIENKR